MNVFDGENGGSAESSESGDTSSGENGGGSGEDESELAEEILLADHFMINQCLMILSLAHTCVAFALLVAYYQLKARRDIVKL